MRLSPGLMQPNDDSEIDRRLLDRIVDRDPSAIGELYDRHARVLYALIVRIVRTRAEAEEVLQEVFLSVWTRAETYNELMGSGIAWLVRIARNRAIDRFRADGVRVRALEGMASSNDPMSATPEQSAALSEEQQAVGRALAALSREQRELIEHAFFLGYTHAELAARFQLPLGTVKTRIRAGMLVLRRELQHLKIDISH